MAITNLGELKTAITTWSHRNNLNDPLDDFVTLAEARISRNIYFREFEVESDLVATIGNRFIALPVATARFVRPIVLWFTTYLPRWELRYASPARLDLYFSPGQPYEWSVDSGGRIAFDAIPDKPYTYTLRYVTSPKLVVATDTNWLLDTSPDVYLFGALIESAIHALDSEQQARWTDRYEQAIEELKNSDHRTKALEQLESTIPLRRYRSHIIEGC